MTVLAAERGPRLQVPRLGLVIASHPIVDAYAGYLPPLLGVLALRCDATPAQLASLLGLGSIVAGGCQPVSAWLSDRLDSRVLAPLGLIVAATALSLIGLPRTFSGLLALYLFGMLGVGVYHPIAAASTGRLSGDRRGLGITIFFVAGMLGAATGPLLSSRLTAIDRGFEWLAWTMIPGILCGLALYPALRRVSHHGEIAVTRVLAADRPLSAPRPNGAVTVLFLGNALRYTVHLSTIFLFVPLSLALVSRMAPGLGEEQTATRAAVISGELNAFLMVGVGLGGLLIGSLVPAGREKWFFVITPVVTAPAALFMTDADPMLANMLALVLGIGAGGTIPLSISAAQRLLPNRTGFASGLMMGGAWAIAATGPPIVEAIVRHTGLRAALFVTGAALVSSGAISILLPAALLRDSASRRSRPETR